MFGRAADYQSAIQQVANLRYPAFGQQVHCGASSCCCGLEFGFAPPAALRCEIGAKFIRATVWKTIGGSGFSAASASSFFGGAADVTHNVIRTASGIP